MTNDSTKRIAGLALALLFLVSVLPFVAVLRQHIYLNDDAYISLTYAKNIIAGNGFVYNHAPATAGTTSPLMTLLVVALGMVVPSVSLATIAAFVSAVCWAGIAWIFYAFRSAWRLTTWQAAILGACMIVFGNPGSLGMDTYLFTFLLVLSASVIQKKLPFLAGIVTGLAALARGEGVLLLLLAVCAFLVFEMNNDVGRKVKFRQSLRTLSTLLIGFSAVVVPWMLYATRTFGSPLPDTLAAKQAQAASHLWLTFQHRLVHEWMQQWGSALSVHAHPLLSPWWVLLALGAYGIIMRFPRLWLLPAWTVVYVLGYTTLRVAGYGWYQSPILLVAQLVVGVGILYGVGFVQSKTKSHAHMILASVIVVVLVGAMYLPLVRSINAWQGDQRGSAYMALAQWFREHTTATDSVAYIEVGYLGFYTNNSIIDLAGLTMPDAIPHVAKADFAYSFWQHKPDYLIYRDDFHWAFGKIIDNPAFPLQYTLASRLPGPTGKDLIIYEKIK